MRTRYHGTLKGGTDDYDHTSTPTGLVEAATDAQAPVPATEADQGGGSTRQAATCHANLCGVGGTGGG